MLNKVKHMKKLETKCFLCGQELRYNAANKNIPPDVKTTKNTHDHNAKSLAHLGHVAGKRSRSQFINLGDYWKMMGILNPQETKTMCYECHEVVLHNPVFNEKQLQSLQKNFKGKDCSGKIITLNRIFEEGLKHYKK